ncbi:hypothetical protein QBC34DRAFT_413789 [Podospora aff. communis PSN243]|uniref:MARVEL domain-containing protein n=1 Tax=Podospora aff. communis PSN243 TaxID=3040156 RepID=A0AAV9GCI2_9PEZI|nr:hypothetical protein QBC34DRAFT_413789 [Podospora aff. communis PSN243]
MFDLLDEAVLKFISLTIRFAQFVLSLVIVGCISQFLTSLSDLDLALPQTHVAVLAISCVAALWSLVALLLTCCAGRIMLELETTLDVICAGMSIAQAAMLSKDAMCTTRTFVQTYVEAWKMGALPSRGLVKVCFGVAIVDVILFSSTSIMSWAIFMIKRRRDSQGHHGK